MTCDNQYYIVSGHEHPFLVFRELYANGKYYRYLWNPVDAGFSLLTNLPDGIDLIKQEINKEDATFFAKKETFRWHENESRHKLAWSWRNWIDVKCLPFVEEVIKRGAPLCDEPDRYCELYTVQMSKRQSVGVCRVRKAWGKVEYFFWDPDSSDYTKQYKRGYRICDRYFSEDVELAGCSLSTLQKENISCEYACRLGQSMVNNHRYVTKRHVEMTWFEWITCGYYLFENFSVQLCRFEGRLMPLKDRPEDVEVLEEKAKTGSIIDLDRLAERYMIYTKSQSYRKAAEITIKALTSGDGFSKNQQKVELLTPLEKTAWDNCISRVERLYLRRNEYRIREMFIGGELNSWLLAKFPPRGEDYDWCETTPRLSDYYDDMGELEVNTSGDCFD